MKYFQTTITVPPELSSMSKIRKLVEERCVKFGYPDHLTYLIVTAVDETCANVIKYAYKKIDGSKYAVKNIKKSLVQLILRADSSKFEIDVLDTGFQFNPVTKSTGKIDLKEAARKKGGMGIHFLKNILDMMDYEYSEDKKNVLRMTKYFQ